MTISQSTYYDHRSLIYLLGPVWLTITHPAGLSVGGNVQIRHDRARHWPVLSYPTRPAGSLAYGFDLLQYVSIQETSAISASSESVSHDSAVSYKCRMLSILLC